MAGWSGFSEEDLHQLKKNHSNEEFENQNVRKVNLSTLPKRQKPREKIKSKNTAIKKDKDGQQETAVELVNSTTTAKSRSDSSKFNPIPEGERSLNQDKFVEDKSEDSVDDQKEKIPEIILEPERIQEIELTALQKMQQKQKEIEDQNKKKKAALQETIKERFKRTQAEANTLKYVHKELAHLDNLLTADVALLRDTIEEADREYHHALKRYEHAEAEFVAAKLDLHRKTEKKEMLTEHLLAVIQQNEERKAKKLEELMAKLDVSDVTLDNTIDNHNVIDDSEKCDVEVKGIEQNGSETEDTSLNTINGQSNNENEVGKEKIEINKIENT